MAEPRWEALEIQRERTPTRVVDLDGLAAEPAKQEHAIEGTSPD